MSNGPLVKFKGELFKEVKSMSLDELFKDVTFYDEGAEQALKLLRGIGSVLPERVYFISILDYNGTKALRKMAISPAQCLCAPLTPEELDVILECENQAKYESSSPEEWESMGEEGKVILTLYSGQIFNAGKGAPFQALCHYIFHYLQLNEFFNGVLMYNEVRTAENPSELGSEFVSITPLRLSKE